MVRYVQKNGRKYKLTINLKPLDSLMKIKKIYIASPLYSTKEQKDNCEIDEVLRSAGYNTFLPQRDGFTYVDLFKQVQNEGYTHDVARDIALGLIMHLDVY